MSATPTGIRFTPEEKAVIQKYAAAHDQTFSDAVKSAILEKIEDEYDLALLLEAIAADDGTRYTLDEVDAMMELN